MRTWCLSWDRAEVAALLTGSAQLHIAGLTKTQTVRVVGFVLIAIGATLLLLARRRHRRALRAGRTRHRSTLRRVSPTARGGRPNGRAGGTIYRS